MGILVQKFGGTSVASVEKMNEVCNIIEKYKKEGNDLVVVVSAMGRMGEPYATDTLLSLVDNNFKNNMEKIIEVDKKTLDELLVLMKKIYKDYPKWLKRGNV